VERGGHGCARVGGGLPKILVRGAALCVTQENTKNTVPKPIRGVPELVWAGTGRRSKSGSPRSGLEFVLNRGLTYTVEYAVLAMSHNMLSRNRVANCRAGAK